MNNWSRKSVYERNKWGEGQQTDTERSQEQKEEGEAQTPLVDWGRGTERDELGEGESQMGL